MILPPPLSRRERERQARRDAMLSAARAVFAEKGYQQASLDEIAKRAEFGKGTLYNYFPGGKDELLRAVLDGLFTRLAALMHPLLEAPVSTLDGFCGALHTYFERLTRYFYDNRDLFHLAMRESYRLRFAEDAAERAYLHRQVEQMVTHLEGCLCRHAAAGIIKALPARTLAHALVACAAQHIMGQEAMGWPQQPEQAAREAADFMTELLVTGMARPPSAR